MNLSEEKAAGVHSEILSCAAGETQENVEKKSHRPRPLFDFLKDPSVEEGKELGDPGQESDSGLLHAFQQIGRLQALEESDPGPKEEPARCPRARRCGDPSRRRCSTKNCCG
jgi:hypothetical protein